MEQQRNQQQVEEDANETEFPLLFLAADCTVSPLSLCDLTSSVFCFPALSFSGIYLSRLLPGSRSFLLIHPPLLDVLMPVETWFLASKAKSISLSALHLLL